MLNFDVVVSTTQTEPGGSFRGVSSRRVEFSNQGPEIDIHRLILARLLARRELKVFPDLALRETELSSRQIVGAGRHRRVGYLARAGYNDLV